MRFGGHETFHLREGWLHKACRLIEQDPCLLVDQHAPDYLGVGKNMAKAIRHWVLAAGLARPILGKNRRLCRYELTELGKVVWSNDRYFLDPGTWWAIHINLVSTAEHAYSWHWFFNSFNQTRFDRSTLVDSLKRHLVLSNQRMPNLRTLERDIACFLGSYAQQLPQQPRDPEETTTCPLVELGLMFHYKESGGYEIDRGPKSVPAWLVGYTISKMQEHANNQRGLVDIPFTTLASDPGGPGRVLLMTSENLYDALARAVSVLGESELRIIRAGGEQMVQIRPRSTLEWLRMYYSSIAEEERYVG